MSLESELKAYARKIGLDAVGIAAADPFTEAEAVLVDREARRMRTTFEEPDIYRRSHPEAVLPGVKSIIAAGIAYVPKPAAAPQAAAAVALTAAQAGAWDASMENSDTAGPRGWLSKYCRGDDYHGVLQGRLADLAEWLHSGHPNARFHICVDTEPPIDRAIAQRAGLGFYGKSGSLINPDFGTWLFLGEILTTIELRPDPPWHGTCGDCTRCIDACPTGAIIAPGEVNPFSCLSYVTQMKGSIPAELREPMGRMLFGCDICQDVCPYNLKTSVLFGDHPEFTPRPEVGADAGPNLEDVLRMSKSEFKTWFGPTAAAWRGKTVLQRNAVIALGNSGDPRSVPLLESALSDSRPLLRGHAAWSLGQMGQGAKAGGRPEITGKAQAALTAARTRETDLQVLQEINLALETLGMDT